MSRPGKQGYENSTQMSKMLPASNIYRVGDYVYVETQPSHPYQIRRIEELTKTSNGQVEAKVSCFYRRRDLSNVLGREADKHVQSAEIEGEINIGCDVVSDEDNHQLKLREVFLSRQLEIINANTIRGKCSVTLYSEVEALLDYLKEDDWFYYLLVYDPQQKTLLADCGEISVGDDYQTEVEENLSKGELQNNVDLETLVWDPKNQLSEKQVDQFLVIARSIGTFARALDTSSSSKESSLHLSAAAASRDITLFQALTLLHKSNYDLGKASTSLVPDGGPILCRDEMEEWTSGEAALFEEGIRKHGKEFNEIQQEYLPWKSISSIIEYYYMWKTTDKYVQQKRLKAQEGDSKVTQIFIPSSNTAINLTLAVQASSQYQVTPTGSLVSPNYMCESCFCKESVLWYPWGTATNCKLYLCKDCWVYWKKCGGLKKSTKSSEASADSKEACYKCRICNKKFNRAERLSSHMATHRGYDCTEVGCGKTFNLKAHLTRHLAKSHGVYSLDSKLKVKTPFVMTPTPYCRATRQLCKGDVRLRHFARSPTDCIDSIEVKTQATKVITAEKAKVLIDKPLKKRSISLESVLGALKKMSSSKHNAAHIPNQGSGAFSHTSITQNLKAKSLKSPTPIMPGGHKRPADNDANDTPSAKRQQQMPQSSPLGRKGYGCAECGKVLHSQVSMQHHMQMHHKKSSDREQPPPPQIHIPQKDGHKRYNQHHQQQQHYHDMPPQSYPPHHPSNQHYADANGGSKSSSLKSRAVSGGSTSRKQSYKGIVQQNRRDPDMQFVAPPQEFLFNATKESRKSRRSLPSRVQRKIARKPFVQIKCSQELRDSITCKKNDLKTKTADPIVIDDD